MSGAPPSIRLLGRRVRRASVFAAVALAVCAFALRAGLIAHTPGYVPVHDDGDYTRIGWSMAQGRGYPGIKLHHADGRVTTLGEGWRPPLWPATLAVLMRVTSDPVGHLPRSIPGLTVLRLSSAALGTLAVLLTALLCARLWGARAGWWTGALAAVYLPLALLSTVLFSENLFVCLELGALLVALGGPSPRRAAAAGALVGLAWLTRSNGVLLLAPVVWLVAGRAPATSATGSRGRGRVLRAGAAVAACVAVVAPWTARNAIQLHHFVPVSTETGGTLLGTYNLAALRDRRDPGAWRGLANTRAYRRLVPPGTAPVVADSRMTRAAIEFAKAHPAYIGTVFAWNARRMVELAGRRRWRYEAAKAALSPGAADAAVVFAWVVMLLAAAGLATGALRRTPAALWLAPALMLLSALLVNVETPRFRAPIDPFLLALAGVALARAGSGLETRRRIRARSSAGPRPPSRGT